MKVFVVLTEAMGGVQFVGVYPGRSDADRRAIGPIVGTGTRVVEFNVVGAQPDPHVVYVAQTYDPTMDVHNFEGVYGNYDSADRASGPRGSTLNFNI